MLLIVSIETIPAFRLHAAVLIQLVATKRRIQHIFLACFQLIVNRNLERKC